MLRTPSLRTGKAFCAGADLAVVSAPTIAANAPLSVRASKRIAYRSASCGSDWEDDVWQLNSRECRDVFTSADGKEGPRAFAEKRPPVWRGE